MRVIKQRNEAFEPAVNTLWVDSSGQVYYLHDAAASASGMYQLTCLHNGKCYLVSDDKVELVNGLTLCSCPVLIENECVDRRWATLRESPDTREKVSDE